MLAVAGIFENAVSEEIQEVLRKQNAEEEFNVVCELLAKWFPETLAFRPFLEGDPDDRGRWIVMMRIVLPYPWPKDRSIERDRGYHRDLNEQRPNDRKRTCVRYLDFADRPNALESIAS